MEITYIGHACFKIKGKETSLVIDPYNANIGYKLPKLEADLLLVSHQHPDHNNVEGVAGYSLLIDGPGEYETKGVFVYGIGTAHDDKKGEERGQNTIYLVDIDGFTLLHLGDLGHELSDETLEKIAKVDVLMIPVGGKYTIDAKTAVKVISSIEPGIVIPMHYKTADLTGVDGLDGLDKFLNEMGTDPAAVKKEDKLKLSTKNDVPEDTQLVILNPAH
jgi:L-ascorbate metabolism protein UlaG (beta-lactamase superfamily)